MTIGVLRLSLLVHGAPGGTEGTVATLLVGALDEDFGYSVSGAGDVNGDGYQDFVLGNPSQNYAQLIFGSSPDNYLTLTNAETFFNLAQYGDMVRVLHTSRPINDLLTAQDMMGSRESARSDASQADVTRALKAMQVGARGSSIH